MVEPGGVRDEIIDMIVRQQIDLLRDRFSAVLFDGAKIDKTLRRYGDIAAAICCRPQPLREQAFHDATFWSAPVTFDSFTEGAGSHLAIVRVNHGIETSPIVSVIGGVGALPNRGSIYVRFPAGVFKL